MPKILHRFLRHEGGASHEALAVTSAVITLVCLLGAQFLDRLSRSDSLPRIAIISADGRATSLGGFFAALSRPVANVASEHFGDVDYTATGSLPENSARPVILDPCAARK